MNLDVLHNDLLMAVESRNKREIVRLLKDIFYQIPAHPSYYQRLIQSMFERGFNRRDYQQVIGMYRRAYPTDPIAYWMRMSFARGSGKFSDQKEAWREACENLTQGFHFQPNITASIFDAENSMAGTLLACLNGGNKIREFVTEFDPIMLKPVVTTSTSSSESLKVETRPAEPCGLNALSLCGRIEGMDRPASYYFQYGTDIENLNATTPRSSVPAGKVGLLRDSGSNLFKRINVFSNEVHFDDIESPESHPLDQYSMRLEWPFGKDRNHLDGIGVIDLLMGWKTAAQHLPLMEPESGTPKFPTIPFPNEGVDLRDAELTVTYRTDDLNLKKFVPVAWIHGRTGTAYSENFDDLAAWALTANMTDKVFTADGELHKAIFTFSGHSSDWSFCGSNIAEMGNGMRRYTYAPIENLLSNNLGGNVCLAFIGGDELDTPEGSLEIADISLRYRSRSLLVEGQGATLIKSPSTSINSPTQLTDGTLGILEAYWFAKIDDVDPLDLEWQLRGMAQIESFVIRQNTLAPSQEFEIALSSDGETFNTVFQGEMDDVDVDPAKWGDQSLDPGNPGLCQLVVLPQPMEARHIRLRLCSGYQEKWLGLDSFEVFGTGLAPIPCGGEFTFAEIIDDLTPGSEVFYQLIVDDGNELHSGDVLSAMVPSGDEPQILDASAMRTSAGGIEVQVRTRAAGAMASLCVKVLDMDDREITTRTISVGQWESPRHTMLRFDVPVDIAVKGSLLTVENAAGRAEKFVELAE